MSPKSLALIAAAVAVMAMGVYLFIQVKSTPAQAHVSPTPSPSPSPTPIAAAQTETSAPSRPAPTQARPTAPAVATGNAAAEPPAMPASADESQRANPKLDEMMQLANKAYDTQDFDQAIAIAGKVLAKEPGNVRMIRIMVSANCIGGDAGVAQQYYEKLPPNSVDRQQMKARCDRYQVALKD